MDSSHKSFFNTVVIIQNFCYWSETVCCAWSVWDNSHFFVIFTKIDTNNENWNIIFWWSWKNDFLATSFNMKFTFILAKKNTSWFTNVISSNGSPSNLSWICFMINLNKLPIYKDSSFCLFNSSWESTVYRVIFKKVHKVIKWHKWIINSRNLSFTFVLKESRSENKSSDSSESIDTHSYSAHNAF